MADKGLGVLEIRKLLRGARVSLGFDVAFVSQFVGARRVFRYVDKAENNDSISEGQSELLASSYCKAVVDGRLPELVRDIREDPSAQALSITLPFQLGAHVSVPLWLADGTLFGTFCCFAHEGRPSLDPRDLATLRSFAEIAAGRLDKIVFAEQELADKERRISDVLASAGPDIVYQPVFDLDDLRITGAEALSRFPQTGDNRSVETWFREAKDVELQVELEIKAVRNAIAGFQEIWRTHRIPLNVNASAATIVDDRFWDAFEGVSLELIVIELTEHEHVQDYAALLAATKRFRDRGAKLAVDDVGAGYASMRHVLNIRPDILKLDIALIRSIDSDDLKAALTASLKHFADQFSCRVVAEGVETRQELAVLRQLGLKAAQGYLLGRPASLDTLKARLEHHDDLLSGRLAGDAA